MRQEAAIRMQELRAVMAREGVAAFILPVGDEYLGEYVPPSAQRLAWLTGFTGSAGLAVVTAQEAALFVDGRYTLQARQEVDEKLYTHFNIADTKPEAWLTEQLEADDAVGYDPWLHSQREVERLEKALSARGIRVSPLSSNPVDGLWSDRPAPPESEIFAHALDYAGETHAQKRARVGEAIQKAGADAAVMAAPDSVNWLLNIRGGDVPYSPLALAYALVSGSGKTSLYIDSGRVPAAACAHLMPGVEMRPPLRLDDDLFELGLQRQRVLVDFTHTPAWFVQQLKRSGATVVEGADPAQRFKAVKNAVELSGMRAAHRRDGLALTRFLSWLEKEAARRDLTEREAAAHLLDLRRAAPEFVSPSFETIAGSGPNGAIVHYRVTQHSNRVLHQGDLFLLDSGGQYPDGTTDITRTVAVGEPLPEHCERFTRVLKGHIALAMARFPEGTCGSQLDALARQALWEAGLDYDHGTGHGVGHFLNVHEGPQRIGKRGGDAPLEAGMIVSNEPGYYREGRYGIRIESLVAVTKVGEMENGKPQLGFETLSCAPMDRNLIAPSLLTGREKDWLNRYHAWVLKTHADSLDEGELAWLKHATKPVD